MQARFVCHVLGLSAGLLLCLVPTSEAAESNKVETRGKAILQEKCGRCHAIEAVGESPLKGAPAMRDVYGRFNPRELQAELSEGKVSKHKEMPQIAFSDEDVYASSMLLQRGNKIGGLRELDIAAMHSPPAKPGKALHLACKT